MADQYEDEMEFKMPNRGATMNNYQENRSDFVPDLGESLLLYEDPVFADEVKRSNDKKVNHLRDILNSILPPRKWMQDNRNVVQQVSAAAAVRDDASNLQMKLDNLLQLRQARESGICPVREQLFSQCFDELIRQVTVECPERGLLLLRVRDEVRMTIAAYSTLYESSITFGMRKTLQAEQGTTEMQDKIEELENEKKKMEKQYQELRNLYEAIEKREAERRVIEEKKRQKEKEFLRFQGTHLETFLKTLS
eukprot:TRINITY_DN4175_c0_g1_i3.p1 TRINITY_DN4175_c0_g1~~TRINITY_DN4175_c0_g1_i3.p1  ORF type:complete len:251 (+),score=43.98 TRINITY_DN4175_c0_g1_i3:103-855(+)